jgi:hypothetical protein
MLSARASASTVNQALAAVTLMYEQADLQIAHLMRLRAARAGLRMSVRELLRELAGISETVLLYHGDRGRPRAHRMLTETSPVQDKLTATFGLARYAPRR